MLPSIRQRLMIGTGVVLGALCWLVVAAALRAADGSTGLTLTSARVGLVVAVVIVALAGLPAMGLGLISSATGHAMSGIFTVAAALGMLAAVGGSMEGWLKSATLTGDYKWLIFETLIWQVGVLLMLFVIQRLRSPLRTRWPALAFGDHLGVDTPRRSPFVQVAGSGLVCGGIAAVVGYILIHNADTGQVICGLIIAFLLGGLIAQTAFPFANPLGVLSSPFLVAVCCYGYILIRFGQTEPFLKAWYHQSLPGLALALPIHYASAGLVGCTLGMGMAQTFNETVTDES